MAKIIWVLMMLEVALLSGRSFAGEALVLWKEGPISLHRAESDIVLEVSVGTLLGTGDRLRLSPAARVSIRYPDGRVELVSSAKDYTVGKMGGLRAVRGLARETNPFQHHNKQLKELLFSGEVLRGQEGALCPRGNVLSTRPAFIWVSSADQVSGYITIGSKDGPVWQGRPDTAIKTFKADGKRRILAMEFPLKIPDLVRGKRYYWKVEGGIPSGTGFFVLGPGKARGLEAELSRQLSSIQDKATGMNVRASVLKSRGLLSEAVREFLSLRTRYPGESYPCQALSILFAELGFPRLARSGATCGEGR